MYGRPFVCCHNTCDFVMSPDPPGFTANALFLPSAMNLSTVSYSARVIVPSLFASILSKNPSNAFPASSFDSAPSLFLSRSVSILSNGGSWFPLSPAPPGAQPAKYSAPSVATGDVQQPDGIPATDHFSSPV